MILLFGPAGTGKSTQGQLLAKQYGWHWVSTGNIFRASTDPEVKEILASGRLVSDEVTYRVFEDYVEGLKDAEHVIVDGFPRTLVQAEWLMLHQDELGRRLEVVVVLEVPLEEIMKRLSTRGRPEDTEAAIATRMKIYHEQTDPILDYLRAQGVTIVRVDGTGSENDIQSRVQAELKKLPLVRD